MLTNHYAIGKTTVLCVQFERYNEVYERVERILNSFGAVINRHNCSYASSFTLTCKEDSIKLTSADADYEYTDISQTDVYPIFYAMIYYFLYLDGYTGMHSVAVSNDKYCYIISGTFGTGKSSLAANFMKLGWEVISADQTILRIGEGQTWFCEGSSSSRISDESGILQLKENRKEREITAFIVIKGLADGGITTINLVDAGPGLRSIWERFVWPWNTPISRYSQLCEFMYNDYCDYLLQESDLLRKNKFYFVRGDVSEIAEYFCEFEEP